MLEYQVTAILIASKLNEVDDRIVYLTKMLDWIKSMFQRNDKKWQTSSRGRSQDTIDKKGDKIGQLVPTFESIVEAERRVLTHFKWDINFVLPLTFVRILLSQGVLFTSELTMYEEKLAPVDYK